MKYRMQIELRLPTPDGQAEALADRLAEAVFDLEDVVDPDLGAVLSEGRFDISMIVDADDLPAAITASLTATRAALHTAGVPTPGWEKLIRDIIPTVYDQAGLDEGCREIVHG